MADILGVLLDYLYAAFWHWWLGIVFVAAGLIDLYERVTGKSLHISAGMPFSVEGARQFLTGYFAAVDNFHNPDESQSTRNMVTLYLLKESFPESTP